MTIEIRLPRVDESNCESCSYPRPATSVIGGLPLCDECAGAHLLAEKETLGALLALILHKG